MCIIGNPVNTLLCVIQYETIGITLMKNESNSTLRTIFYSYFVLIVIGIIYFIVSEKNQEQTYDSNITTVINREKVIVPQETRHLYGEELLTKLKAGGLVVYFRHFATDNTKLIKDKTLSKHLSISSEELMASCHLQRPLSDYGRAQAKLVNMGLTENGIPIGQSYSSPYCRVFEGASLAFDKAPEVQRNLIYQGGGLTYEEISNHIKPMLGENPEYGNTFIMSHRTQMDDIAKIDEGEAFVFEPLGDSRFNLLGRIQPAEWLLAKTDAQLLGASYYQKYFYSKGAQKLKAKSTK